MSSQRTGRLLGGLVVLGCLHSSTLCKAAVLTRQEAVTILLAEAATLGHATAHGLIQERFFDTLLGCLVGLLGAVALHNPVFRRVGSRLLRQLIPDRFLQV